MSRLVDRLSAITAGLAAWMFFAIGLMVTYEVIMRKVFNAPTIWVEEVARFFQIWATYIAAAYVLNQREMIVVEIGDRFLGPKSRRVIEFLSLFVIGVFSTIALWHGTGILLDSIELERATSTMLGVPLWMTESAITVGFALLLLQCAAELVRLLRGELPPPKAHHGPGSADL